jgi:hypothetical protein
MGPIFAIVAVGTVLALAFSSSRSAPRSIEVGRADRLDEAIRGPLLRNPLHGHLAPDRRNPGRTVLAQGLHGGGE